MAVNYSDVGKYERVALLGEGQFGKVYRVLDRALMVERALKVIPASNPQELVAKLKEAQTLEHCKHKHVVEVKEADVQTVDGTDCVTIACELCENGSVQHLLESHHVSIRQAVKITQEALLGLAHLHSGGVMHCDIKPGNLLLDHMFTVKLSDFGLAIHMHAAGSPSQVYTLHCPPEWLAGQPWSGASDIYAMGVTLYRLLNNTADFRASLPADVKGEILRGQFPNRSGYQEYVPKKLRNICNKAMHLDPTKRYPSAEKFRQALDQLHWGIDWHQITQTEWQGRDSSRSYSMTVLCDPRGWTLNYYVGVRRSLDRCAGGLSSEAEAVRYAHAIITETSLS